MNEMTVFQEGSLKNLTQVSLIDVNATAGAARLAARFKTPDMGAGGGHPVAAGCNVDRGGAGVQLCRSF